MPAPAARAVTPAKATIDSAARAAATARIPVRASTAAAPAASVNTARATTDPAADEAAHPSPARRRSPPGQHRPRPLQPPPIDRSTGE